MTQHEDLGQLGNYKLIRVLGQGGFATVYLGQHIHLKNYAAVKVLKMAADAELFRYEAQTIMELTHRNIIRVLDFDIKDDLAFIVMDYAPYGSLVSQYKTGTIVAIDGVLSYAKQAAAALQYAHDHRIIHRDVKPSNLLVGKQRIILLSDFGIALLAESARSARSVRTQDAVGTVAYMAPEQIRGKPRPASDQYALAVTVYEWLCGRRPFRGTIGEVTAQHLSAPPPPLRKYNPDISPEVEDVVLQALAKNPTQRFTSIADFADTLENAAGIRPRFVSEEHFTTEAMPSSRARTRDTVVLPVERSSISRRPTSTQQQSSRNLASVRTVLEGEGGPETGQSRRPQPRRPPPISRRTLLIAALGVGGVGGIAGLAFAALHHAPPPVSYGGTPTPTVAPTPTQAAQPTTVAPTPTAPPTAQATQPATPPSQATQPPQAVPQHATKLFATFKGTATKAPILSVAWSTGSLLASGGADDTVQIWDTTAMWITAYTGHTAAITSVSWSPDGNRVASASNDKSMRIHALGAPTVVCSGHTAEVTSVAWSPDGKSIASGSADTTVRVWNTSNGSPAATFRSPAAVTSVAWSPDGKSIASGSADNTVRIWNSATGSAALIYRSHTAAVASVAWSPDGKSIASGSADTTVRVWNASNGSVLQMYQGHSKSVYGIAWSPDGKWIASASGDTTAHVWDAATSSTLQVYKGHLSTVWGICWSPDGTRIASASDDTTAQIWQA